MDTVVCGKCGQRFAIHNDGVHDAQLAEKQVDWLEDHLVWDHIEERKHHGSVELPNLRWRLVPGQLHETFLRIATLILECF